MKFNIVTLPGDGIGPEIVATACGVLSQVEERFSHAFVFQEEQIGGIALDETGDPLPERSLRACREADAVLLGAVGGPKWDDPQAKKRPEQGLLALRKGLGLYANLRPVRVHQELLDASPLRRDRIENVDMLVVRELTGGIYFGEPSLCETRDGLRRAVDTMVYDEHEIRRVARVAFGAAMLRRKRVTSVDKANVLASSRLWREVVSELAAEYPEVSLEHQLVDSAAMRMVTQPDAFDVVLTGNMFGDILSDEASVLTGSLGMLPSASMGDGKAGLFEPIHGSAPDIAGQGIANPMATILSAAMMLRHSLGLEAEAVAVEEAVATVLREGGRTRDLGGSLSTQEVGARVSAALVT